MRKPLPTYLSSTFWPAFKAFLIAAYQIGRNAGLLILTLVVAAVVLLLPDQAKDMIGAVLSASVGNPLFVGILAATILWSWMVYGGARVILHITPNGIDAVSAGLVSVGQRSPEPAPGGPRYSHVAQKQSCRYVVSSHWPLELARNTSPYR
ncbi:hypothetical protein [Nibrella saemangeumensis]|uniref:hypothetical protein n=1 Tax=Nibrella saemangeumensis TaxID=1084526 RepID=UPI0031F18631